MELTAVASIEIAAPPEEVFDFITAPDVVGRTFGGWGPIPRALESRLVSEGPMRVGSVRQVVSADGSVIDEEILELERPGVQAYRLARGMRFPFSAIVREARGRWTIDATEGGSAVRWRFVFVLRSALLWPLAYLLAAAFRQAMRANLANTKGAIERAW